jgi:hypothetical protein
MIFYAIFWSTYVPFVLLTLSILAERLSHHPASNAPRQAKPVPVPSHPSRRAQKQVVAAK